MSSSSSFSVSFSNSKEEEEADGHCAREVAPRLVLLSPFSKEEVEVGVVGVGVEVVADGVVGAALVVVEEEEEDEEVSSLEMEVGVVACATGPLLSSFASFVVVVVSTETLFSTTTSSSLVFSLLLRSLPSLSLSLPP